MPLGKTKLPIGGRPGSPVSSGRDLLGLPMGAGGGDARPGAMAAEHIIGQISSTTISLLLGRRSATCVLAWLRQELVSL